MPVQPNDPHTIASTGHPGPIQQPDSACSVVTAEGSMPDLWGAMRGSVTVALGTDLTAGIFSLLDADA